MNSSSSISNDEVSIPISRQGTLLQGEDAVERSSSWFIPKLIRGSESSSKTTASSISVTKRKNGSIKGSIKFSAHNFITQSYDCFTDHYEILGLLGDGGYGEVFRCKHKESGAERAVKVIEMTSEEQGETILAEFQVLRGLDHPNLLKVFQLFEAEEEGIFYIVTDLYEGK